MKTLYAIGLLVGLLGFIVMVYGCESKPATLDGQTKRTMTNVRNQYLETVEHDGHKFVVAQYSHGICVILHPDDGK